MDYSNAYRHSLPANGLYDYLLVATPDKAATERIIEEKRLFFEEYQLRSSVAVRPFITLSQFRARDEMEDTLVRWLQRIVGDQYSFPVSLNNFSGIPPHAVILRVMDPSPFREWSQHLRPIDEYIRSNSCPPAQHCSHPYLAIARELPAPIYEKAIAAYSHRQFHDSFEVNELALLRRSHAQESSKQVAIFRLQPAKQNVYQ